MRLVMRFALLGVVAACGPLNGQQTSVARGRTLAPDAYVSIRNVAGSVRVIGWDHDSVEVRGSFDVKSDIFIGGDRRAVKLGVWDWEDGSDGLEAHFDVLVPKGAEVHVKTVSADITARDVAGSFASAAGDVVVRGNAARVEIEALGGDADIDVNAELVRARTGGGRLDLRGVVVDATASSVDGRIRAEVAGLERGRFESVTGDIHFTGTFEPGVRYDFDSHAGLVELTVPRIGVTVDAASVRGLIHNAFAGDSVPIDSTGGSQQLIMGPSSAGGRVTVRTLKGAIVIRKRVR